MRGSTPCTEGTGSFCRVPSRGFSRTPSDSRLAHLCRIAVRAARIVPTWLFVAERSLDFQFKRCRPCGTEASSTPTRVGPASPAGSSSPRGWRNINRLSIGYAFGPRLRSRLTLGGLTFPRKPCAYGGRASHPSCRYSFRHAHSTTLHGSFRYRFAAVVDALLPLQVNLKSATAARRLVPVIFGAGWLDR